jgi:propionyl-CoA carboxylase beta chain
VAHGAFENDVVALHAIRELFDYLPLHNKDSPPVKPTLDSPLRTENSLR